jgi:predicted phage-related endonuclease
MNAPEKLPVDRRTFLGGSDAAAIVGVSPWKTALEVYLQKRGERDDDDRENDPALQELFEMGKEEEPVIINRLIRRYGVKVTKRSTPEAPNRYVDPEHPFLAAEVDFEWEVTPEIAAAFELPAELIGTIQNGEAKRVHFFQSAQFGDAETEDVPIQYAAQAAHGLSITNRQLCMFAVKCGDDLTVYWIKRDEEIIQPLRQKMVGFWHNHVLAGVPPAPVNLPDVLKLFKRVEAPIVVEADESLYALYCELEKAKDAQKAAEGRIEDLKFDLGKAMLGADAIAREQKKNGTFHPPKPTAAATEQRHTLKYQGAPVMTIVLEKQNRLDTDAVRKKHPEVAAECSKELKFFKFREPTKAEKLLAR